jgi:2-polyprenyl-3-methyl-5-hydroxy-6-metoxy-1,4-benzoquinol methylase
MNSIPPSRSAPLVEPPPSVAASPYQSKRSDVYSSHSLILRLAGDVVGRRLLDVGAAHGYLAEALRSQGFQVTGIEANAVLGEEAAKRCDHFLLLDLDGPLPAFSEPFDVMVFGDVLEHLKNPVAVLRQLAASLKEDGAVIISLPNVANIYAMNAWLARRWPTLFGYQFVAVARKKGLYAA